MILMEDLQGKIQEHETRIVHLESTEKEVRGRLTNLERDIHQLENTIVSENRETRTLFQGTMDKQWDLIKSKDEAADKEKQRKHEMEKTKVERHSEIFLKIGGAGGVLYLFIQSMIDLFSK